MQLRKKDPQPAGVAFDTAALIIVFAGGTSLLLQAMAYASFPLPVGGDGKIHLRLIPFLPLL